MGNVLFRLSDLERSSSQRAIEEFGAPQRGKVSRKDGAPLEKGLPEYLVEPVEYEAKTSEFLDEVQLVDFGECMYPWDWTAFLFDSLKSCSSILYSESPQTNTHTNVAPSSRVGVPTFFNRGGRYLEPWLHGKRVHRIP